MSEQNDPRMKVTLNVITGPHLGREYQFDSRDSFLVGRSRDAHFQLDRSDPYFSRRHFVIELQPPRCRLLDLKSRNGVFVNGNKVVVAELRDGDRVEAGHTVFRVQIEQSYSEHTNNVALSAEGAVEPMRAASGPQLLAPDQLIGDYRIVRQLGRGAMGVVYLGVRKSDGLPVAIKQIHHSAPPKSVERFLREARILGDLKHRHIVGLIEALNVDGSPFLVMEFVDGVDAQSRVKTRGCLPVASAVRIVLQIAGGLQHAHERGFVHRDVKPSNILIGGPKDRRVTKLADFGLARAYETSQLSGLTMHDEIGGTPAFMPPEQITHYRDVKPPADQYSLAATLYYLLSGQYIYDFSREGGMPGRLVMIMTDPPIPLRDRCPDVPCELANAIEKGLNKDPERRYPTMAEFQQALRSFANNAS